jgi:hypothetical protein
MAKIYRPPKDSRDTIINANIGDISDTVHSQSPFHHVQQKRLLELKFPNWKEWAFTDGPIVLRIKNFDLSLLELECTTLKPAKPPQ